MRQTTRSILLLCLGSGLAVQMLKGDSLDSLSKKNKQTATVDTSFSDPAAIEEINAILKDADAVLASGDIHGASRIYQEYSGLKAAQGVPALVRLKIGRLGLAVEKAREEEVMKRFEEKAARVNELLASGSTREAKDVLDALSHEMTMGSSQKRVAELREKIDAAIEAEISKSVAQGEQLADRGQFEEAEIISQRLISSFQAMAAAHRAKTRLDEIIMKARVDREKSAVEDTLKEVRILAQQGKINEALALARNTHLSPVVEAVEAYLAAERTEIEKAIAARALKRSNEILAEAELKCDQAKSAADAQQVLLPLVAFQQEMMGRQSLSLSDTKERVERAINSVRGVIAFFEALDGGHVEAAARQLTQVKGFQPPSLLSASTFGKYEALVDKASKARKARILPPDRHDLKASLSNLSEATDAELREAGLQTGREDARRFLERLVEASDLLDAVDARGCLAILNGSNKTVFNNPLKQQIYKEAALIRIGQLIGKTLAEADLNKDFLKDQMTKLGTEGKINEVVEVADLASNLLPADGLYGINGLPHAARDLHTAERFAAIGDSVMAIRYFRKVVGQPSLPYLGGATVENRLAILLKEHPEAALAADDAVLQEIEALRTEMRTYTGPSPAASAPASATSPSLKPDSVSPPAPSRPGRPQR